MKGSLVTLSYLGNKQQHWQKDMAPCTVIPLGGGGRGGASDISGRYKKISCFMFSASSFFCIMWLRNSLQLFLSESKVLFIFIYSLLHVCAGFVFYFVCGNSQPWYSTCGCFLLWFLSAQPFLSLTVCIVGGRRVLMDCCIDDMFVFCFCLFLSTTLC